MARVALVSHDVQTVLGGKAGGVGAFVTHFARLLLQHGDRVTIILTRQEETPVAIDAPWREKYKAWGIDLIELHNTPPSRERWSDAWPLRLSEQLAPYLTDFDIAYFQDWANVAFQTVRRRRFGLSPLPRVVTVLHGPSEWVRSGNHQYPNLPEDLHVEFMERYSARHSDAVVAPSRFMLDWATRHGWQFDRAPQVLGLPFLPTLPNDQRSGDPVPVATGLKRLLLFGRVETRKGGALFADAIQSLGELWSGIEEIVLLGDEKEPGGVAAMRQRLASTGLKVTHIGHLDSEGALAYLTRAASDTLAIVPSPEENFPYAVIEASHVPGLHLICSSGGGIAEVLGPKGAGQLFAPYPAALAAVIRERFTTLSSATGFASYGFAAANSRWLDFHCQTLATPTGRPGATLTCQEGPPPTVDVCITYYNKHEHFPQLLDALEKQSTRNFGVIAVDDGSPDPAAIAVFDELSRRYARPGWTFFRQANAFVDAARNRAASRSRADFLLFIDADDVPAPATIEKLLSGAIRSGDDCVVSGGFLFEGDDTQSGIRARYLPLGPDLISGLVDPIVFGPSLILIRRRVFEALGGYRELRGVAHEDWELQVRLLLDGYRTDVYPECLLYFRKDAAGLSRTSSDFLAKQRLVGAYDERLATIGLQGLATLVHALSRGRQEPAPVDAKDRLTFRVRQMMARRMQELREPS